jgi:hypothetical protein
MKTCINKTHDSTTLCTCFTHNCHLSTRINKCFNRMTIDFTILIKI